MWPHHGMRKIAIPAAAPEGKLSHAVRPMLATLVAEPFDRPGWLFEIKWDGYRTIAEIQDGRVKLYSRNQNSFDRRFAPIAKDLQGLRHDAVLDGEVVVVDDAGRSSFQLLQNYQKTGQGRLAYYVFDILHLDGRDLRALPLRERKQILARLLRGMDRVLLSEHVEEKGVGLYRARWQKGSKASLPKMEIVLTARVGGAANGSKSKRWPARKPSSAGSRRCAADASVLGRYCWGFMTATIWFISGTPAAV